MFRQTNENEVINAAKIFLEKPSQNCQPNELKNGVENILIILEKNPEKILTLINEMVAEDPYAQAIDIFADLMTKLQLQNSLEKLATLYQSHADKIVETCIYNLYDFNAITKDMLSHIDVILKAICENKAVLDRVLDACDKPDELVLIAVKEQLLQQQRTHSNRLL